MVYDGGWRIFNVFRLQAAESGGVVLLDISCLMSIRCMLFTNVFVAFIRRFGFLLSLRVLSPVTCTWYDLAIIMLLFLFHAMTYGRLIAFLFQLCVPVFLLSCLLLHDLSDDSSTFALVYERRMVEGYGYYFSPPRRPCGPSNLRYPDVFLPHDDSTRPYKTIQCDDADLPDVPAISNMGCGWAFGGYCLSYIVE